MTIAPDSAAPESAAPAVISDHAAAVPAGSYAAGKVLEKRGGAIVFKPTNTTYELHLQPADGAGDGYAGPMNVPVHMVIVMQARKVWTVPSGGNFIEPIFGKPRTIQGRVKAIDGQTLVIQAGCPIYVKLPVTDSAIDLNSGVVEVGHMVNAMIMPGATYTLISKVVSSGN